MTPGAAPGTAMRWASASGVKADSVRLAETLCETLYAELGSGAPDLLMLFFAGAHVPRAADVAEVFRRRLSPSCLVGCSASGVVSSTTEHESGPAMSALAARLPGVELHPFVLVPETWEEPVHETAAFAQAAPGAEGAELVLLMGDPFSLDAERVLAAFGRHAPGVRVVGGMAGAGAHARSNAIMLNDWVDDSGGVAVALKGALRADVVVSQGCRPLGPELAVTHVDGHVVTELDGQPALERAEQVLRSLSDAERDRIEQGLYVGRLVTGAESAPGSYLIRNLLGADRDRGTLAIGDRLRSGDRLRLHVRDGKAATDDLELCLAPQEFDSNAHAALLYTCNGRGHRLFGRPDADVSTLRRVMGSALPVAGMFCAGEIGPVGGRNHMHGHTASVAIIRPAPPAARPGN